MLIYTIFYSCFIVHKIDSFCFTSSCSNDKDVNKMSLSIEKNEEQLLEFSMISEK